MQIDEPLVLYEPMAQSRHAEAEVLPELELNLPPKQSLQTAVPALGANLPGPHWEQDKAFIMGLKYPILQNVKSMEPWLLQ